ncbi:MAG TPA: carbamoyltransferase C-terminal domain-containing protein [Dehalococcoidia bacterium]|nr:carbamoyltransferase C-terminal domain-containing protein [Dehalococcoidia bacterium]
MLTLGINAAFHDSSACLVEDGRVVAAVEEERLSRIKHGKRPTPFSAYELPFLSIDACLRQAGAWLRDIDHIAYSFDPYLLLNGRAGDSTVTLPLEPSAQPVADEWESAWDPLFLSSIVNAPRHLAGGVPHRVAKRFAGAARDETYRWHFVEHHTAHAASAFLASPFESAAVLTLDGRGERATTSYAIGRGTQIDRIGQVNMPHSLGLLYERVTEYLGFLHSSDEYKVMALASFGEPAYLDDFRRIVHLGCDGQYTVAPLCLEQRFGPRRLPGLPFEQRHYDVARSLQECLEETVLAIAHWLHEATGERQLCVAGGVALNCVLNARLRDDGPFDDLWVQPAAGDAGTSLGAALWTDARIRRTGDHTTMHDAFLGPEFDGAEIEHLLRAAKVAYTRPPSLDDECARLLADGKIIGWYQGRMEFGPRALGARSILASPRDAAMQERLNAIKDREDFRPVAPVVLADEMGEWFVPVQDSPFMLFTHGVRPERADCIPAVRHVDGTARVQSIDDATNPRFAALLRAFASRTGLPVLINTSFNTRGQPIVCTPRQALECFFTTPLDALAIGPFLLRKPEAAA